MQLVPYDFTDIEYHMQSNKMVDAAMPFLQDRFGRGDDISRYTYNTSFQLSKLLSLYHGSIAGKKVLDLGCGISIGNEAEDIQERSRQFEPWFLRILSYHGIEGIGIDSGELEESFVTYEIDLLRPGSLSGLADYSIDAANASSLFNSPLLVRTVLHKNYGSTSGFFISYEEESISGKILYSNLVPQLERIEKPDGFFMYFGLND